MAKHRLFYLMAIFFSGVVCCYDNMLSVVYRDSLREMEENPMGSWLLQYGLDYFVAIKAVTTVLAVLLLYALSFTKFRWVVIVTAIGQAILFWYLNFYNPVEVQWYQPDRPIEHVIDHFIYDRPLPEFK